MVCQRLFIYEQQSTVWLLRLFLEQLQDEPIYRRAHRRIPNRWVVAVVELENIKRVVPFFLLYAF